MNRNFLRTHDWSSCILGAPDQWPRTLRGYVDMVMALPTPAIIFWGPEQTQLYNAGYAEIMGPRHPRYFGRSYRECWPDTYPVIYPWMRAVLDHGETKIIDRTHFELTRHGFVEEAYFTFTFSPLVDDTGAIAGIYQPVLEVTRDVVADRRASTLRALAARPRGMPLAQGLTALERDPHDVTFFAVFVADVRGRGPQLVVQHGLDDVVVGDQLQGLVRDVMGRARGVVRDDVATLVGNQPVCVWGDPTTRAYAVPLHRDPSSPSLGVALFGISPRLAFNAEYEQFLEAISVELATILAEQRTRDALERSEDRLHRVITAVGVGSWELDLDTNEVRADEALLALFSLPSQPMPTLDMVLAQVVDEDRETVRQAIERALAGQDGGYYHAEFRAHASDGQTRWIDGRGRVFFGPDGRPVRMSGIGLDITERRQLLLREQEARTGAERLVDEVTTHNAEVERAMRTLREERDALQRLVEAAKPQP